MNEMELEQSLSALPISQYAFIDTSELVFSERVRYICRTGCPMYGKSWACPPAVGSVEECRARCLAYPRALVFTTLAEVGDISDMEQTLATRPQHEEITHAAVELVREHSSDVMALSAQACALCSECAWPEGPCRRPVEMYPCVESHGILTTDLAERLGIEFIAGNIVTWFSIILYK